MYHCVRCGYITKRKGNLRNHLKRKKVCEPILLDVEPLELLHQLTKNVSQKQEIINTVMSCTNNTTHTTITTPNTQPNHVEETNGFVCRFCDKSFKYRQGRCRHEKHYCKLKPNSNHSDTLQNQVIKLKKTIEEQQQQIKVITNNQRNQITNITNNSNNTSNHITNSFNTVNVNLNTIGNENIEYLKTFLLENINSIIQCKTDFFIEYVKQKHFHPEHIENHNVVSFNQRSNSMYGYTKLESNLERRLKNDITLLLYRNIIHDVNGFLDNQIQNKKNKRKKQMILIRASDSMTNQEDAINDYEHKDSEADSTSVVCKKNIKKVGKHIKEIENTIYNQSKHVYGDLSTYYNKHNVKGNNSEHDDRDE